MRAATWLVGNHR
jgi:hypothetical protein